MNGDQKPPKLGLARRGIEPPIVGARRQDHRHPVVDLRHELVRRACHDGAGRRAAPDFAALQGQIPAKANGRLERRWMRKGVFLRPSFRHS